MRRIRDSIGTVAAAFCLLYVVPTVTCAADRDVCSALENFIAFECPVGQVCTRGLSDLQSHFSVFEKSEWVGLGPEHFQLHYNRYPVIASSRLLNLSLFDVASRKFYFQGMAPGTEARRQLISYPHGYREMISEGDLQGEARTVFVDLDTILVSFHYQNIGKKAITVRPLLVGQFGELPPPPTHSKPGGSKPGPNPLPPFPPGELGLGTSAWYDEDASTLVLTRYLDLPRADSGRLAYAVKVPPGWKARVSSAPGEETTAAAGGFVSSRGQYEQGLGLPAYYYLVGSAENLAPHQAHGFAVVITFGLLHHFGISYLDELKARAASQETLRQEPEKAWDGAKSRWNSFFSSLPQPRIQVPGGDRLYWLSYYTLQRNLYAPDWNFRHVALFETKGWYDAVWQWSVSPFGQLALLPLDPELAKQQTYIFTENALPTGMIPEHIFNTFVPTDTIHPQLLTYGAWLVYLHTRDRVYLERTYGALARHFDWLYAGGFDVSGNIRDKDRDGIFEWGTQPWDNGLDNDPRSDAGLEKFEAVDLNAYVLLSVKCLARMAEELDMPDEAARWKARAEKLGKALVENLYDPESNMFWDRHHDNHRFYKVLGFYNFLPLLAGVPLEESRVDSMIREYLLSPKHFWGKLPFPSLAFSDHYYSATNYMRGPVWPGPTFLLVMTLWKNGFRDEADRAALQFLRVVSEGKGIYENYNSETGEPLYGKRVELISWNAACIIDLFLQLYQVDDGLE